MALVCEDCRVMDGSGCDNCYKLKREREMFAQARRAAFSEAIEIVRKNEGKCVSHASMEALVEEIMKTRGEE